MTNIIYPCFWFDGQAKAAADLYCSIFDDASITTDTPMVVNFEIQGKRFMGLNGGPHFKINPSISLFVTSDSLDKTNEIWDKLIVGGKALMPIGQYPWSERYGWLQDRFGMTWQISMAFQGDTGLKITPSMLFTSQQFGRAEEAIRFYSGIFEGASTDVLIHYPTEDKNEGKVMFSEFRLAQYPLIAMDGPGVHEYVFNEAVSFVVECETQQEIDYYWAQLTAGGEESRCGWLRDKFNVSWQIIPKNLGSLMTNPEKGQRAMEALLKMNKLDIEVLMNA